MEAHGWRLFVFSTLEHELSALRASVRQELAKGKGADHIPAAKRLRSLQHLMFEAIPQDPENKKYLLGNTLGPEFKQWRRAKFSGQYRLFFRFDSRLKVIIYCWVNNEQTLRQYESGTDAYRTFRKLLKAGQVPSEISALLLEQG